MANAALKSLGDATSQDGNDRSLWTVGQYCFSAESQADAGKGSAAAYHQTDLAGNALATITDTTIHDQATAAIAEANGYIQSLEPHQEELSEQFIATDAGLTADSAVTTEQLQANASDNAATLAANLASKSGQDPNSAYNNVIIDQATGTGIGSSLNLGALGSAGGVSGIGNLGKTVPGKIVKDVAANAGLGLGIGVFILVLAAGAYVAIKFA